jgi:hypothetical protein
MNRLEMLIEGISRQLLKLKNGPTNIKSLYSHVNIVSTQDNRNDSPKARRMLEALLIVNAHEKDQKKECITNEMANGLLPLLTTRR